MPRHGEGGKQQHSGSDQEHDRVIVKLTRGASLITPLADDCYAGMTSLIVTGA